MSINRSYNLEILSEQIEHDMLSLAIAGLDKGLIGGLENPALAWIPIREDAANKIVTSSSESEPELLVAQPWDLHQFLIETRIEHERIMRPLLKLNGDFLALDCDLGVSVNKVAEDRA